MDVPLLLRGFVAGGIAVAVFHQTALLLLHLAGLTPSTPWPLGPVPPFGFPAVLSAAFWGGLWGVLLVAVAPGVARSPLRATLFGAIVPTLVAWFVVLPLKGMPMGGGFVWPGILVGPIVNACWGLGTSLLLVALERLAGRTATTA